LPDNPFHHETACLTQIVTRKASLCPHSPIKDYEELLEQVEDARICGSARLRRQPLHYRPLADYLAARAR